MPKKSNPNPPVNVAVAGAAGRMGQAVIAALRENACPLQLALAFEREGHDAIGAIGADGVTPIQSVRALESAEVQVLIDFTTPAATLEFAKICRRRKIGMVVGSTGFAQEQMRELRSAGEEIPVLAAQNMSVGVNALYAIASYAAGVLGAGRLGGGYDIEVSEEHHRHKKDAPSGTALRLGKALADATGGDFNADAVFARRGNAALRGENDIGFSVARGGDIVGTHRVLFAGHGEQLEIIHRSHSRANYAAGAIRAAQYIAGAGAGFYDDIGVLLQKNQHGE